MYQLFLAVGWATEDTTTQTMIDNFNIGFLNSTFVFSAWIDERLFVPGELQISLYPTRETEFAVFSCGSSNVNVLRMDDFYEKNGFKINKDHFLTISRKLF